MNKTTGHTDIQWSLNESQEVVWDDPGERMKLGMTESSKNITIIALCSDAAASEGGQGLSYQYSLVPFFRHDVCNILTINVMQSCMDTAAVQGEDDELDNWNHSKFKNHGLVDGTPTDIWEYKPKYVGSAENDAAGKCRPEDSTTYVYEIATGTNHMLRFGQYKWTCEDKGWQNDTTTFSNYRAGVTDADFAPNMPCKNLTDNLGYGNSSFRTQLLPSQVRQRAHRADKARRSRARKEGRLQAGQDLLVNDDVEIEQLQRVLEGAGSPWTAGRNERFEGVRQKELFGMLGTHVLPSTLPGAGIGGLAHFCQARERWQGGNTDRLHVHKELCCCATALCSVLAVCGARTSCGLCFPAPTPAPARRSCLKEPEGLHSLVCTGWLHAVRMDGGRWWQAVAEPALRGGSVALASAGAVLCVSCICAVAYRRRWREARVEIRHEGDGEWTDLVSVNGARETRAMTWEA